MEKVLGFGIIGCGVIAPHHASSIVANEKARLVAVCDIIVEKAITLKEKYSAISYYTDYREMLKRDDLDVVCICTPSGMHSEMAVSAAQAGIHVFCEKPLDITKEKISAMIDACRKEQIKLGCVFQRRTMPEAIAVKNAIDAGALGKLVLADAYLKYYLSLIHI